MYEKVVLVKPPECSAMNFGTFSLGVVGAAIRDRAEVSIIDATQMSLAEAVENIEAQHPDLVGITVMGLPSIKPANHLIRTFKRQKKTPVIVGGHGASMLPEVLLEAGVDCVVIGEGELTLQEIVRNGIIPGMPGTVTRVNSHPVKGPRQRLVSPLDVLNLPARDLMPRPPNGVYLMESSRGCPHQCKFCETTRFYGTRWRPFSPDRVAREIKCLVHEFDAWIIHIADDNFTASTDRVKKICQKLRSETLPAFFMVSARVDDLVSSPDLLPMMADSRILRITVGIETLDPNTAQEIGKSIPLEVYQEAFTRMRDLGIFSIASLIVGLPGETPAAREQAVELAVKAGPDSAHFLPFLPQPGLPIKAKHQGYDPDPTDIKDAGKFNLAFRQHPTVQARLKCLAELDGIQGMLARASIRGTEVVTEQVSEY